MKTRCMKCKKAIPMGKSLCEECYSKRLKNSKNNIKDKKAEALIKSNKWKNKRKEILLRDMGVCRLCFKQGIIEYRKLEVHHIVKRVDSSDLAFADSNLVTVCKYCHEKLEKLAPSEQKKMLDLEETEENHFTI